MLGIRSFLNFSMLKRKSFDNPDLSNTKQFWKTVKVLSKEDESVSTLTHEVASCIQTHKKSMLLTNTFPAVLIIHPPSQFL